MAKEEAKDKERGLKDKLVDAGKMIGSAALTGIVIGGTVSAFFGGIKVGSSVVDSSVNKLTKNNR